MASVLAATTWTTPASSTESATNVLTGSVTLADGATPASAAVVDLSTVPGGDAAAAFARGVTDASGVFAVEVPATPTLVTLARANGDELTIYVTVSKLVATSDLPNFLQRSLTTVATLRMAGTQSAATAYFVLGRPDFGPITPLATSLANAARVYQDPDLVLGRDDLDDPDLVPPLGAKLDTVAVEPSDDTSVVPLVDQVDPTASGTDLAGLLSGPSGTPDPTASGCAIVATYIAPGRGKAQPIWGASINVRLFVLHCTQEQDDNYDYYAIVWNGKATNRNMDGHYTRLWRFKFRTELGVRYERIDEDPKHDISTGGSTTIHWNIGFQTGVTGGVSGSYTVVKAKKIHPWSDYDNALYHVSWMSNHSYGSSGSDFWNGGGMTIRVPQGDTSLMQDSSNLIYVWRCWEDSNADGNCDPR